MLGVFQMQGCLKLCDVLEGQEKQHGGSSQTEPCFNTEGIKCHPAGPKVHGTEGNITPSSLMWQSCLPA